MLKHNPTATLNEFDHFKIRVTHLCTHSVVANCTLITRFRRIPGLRLAITSACIRNAVLVRVSLFRMCEIAEELGYETFESRRHLHMAKVRSVTCES